MDPDGDLNPDTDDLPLRANTNHILVKHYVLDLTVHFDSKVISGSIVLFLEPRSGVRTEAGGSQDGFTSRYQEVDALEDDKKELETTTTKVEKMCGDAESIQSSSLWHTTSGGEFTLVLDCCDLDVSKVEEVDVTSVEAMLSRFPEVPSKKSGDVSRKPQAAFIQNLISMPSSQWRQQHQLFSLCSHAPGAQNGSTLQFHRDRWSLQVRKNGVTSPQEFPCALRICYETKPAGGSVRWTKDQDNSRDQTTCVDSAFCYSSLEDEGLSVTDYSGMVDDGISCSHGDYPCRFTERSACSQRVIPHRVFSPACILQKAQMGVLKLLPQCLAAAHAVLGVHPFPRLDVLIVPAGFSSLGMASPHIIFLSQSVLSAGSPGSEESLSLCGSRICHEISHSWFGLVIGARDWTEEWISEGFATCLEDIIWAQAQQLSLEEKTEQFDLKALLRWRRLSDELQNSKEELQILRPNMEKTGQVSESGSSTVKHALNPEKPFMQVHYLKGYFLLRFLASQVGEQQFIEFFQLFVKKYHGHLILSQDFLQMLLISFPDMKRKGLTLSAIYADWLDQPGIPKWLYERSAVWSQARLVEEVKAEVVKWILLSQSHHGKGRKRKRMEPKVNYKELTSDQLVMLLELLLEESELSVASLRALQRTYSLQNQDAEVRHRWCELVVKHAYAQAYGDVEHFLIHDQAMGVYLYGELMVQEDPEQQALARHCLSLVQEEMDQSARRVVEEMVL
ncbi:aminopeptidase O isoform X3 [Oreochromis aureus]|uniref:aminopeptidase O isoform X3 n=1 Tax=Oreochromis aureus TaxID=47969 RepID=UPI0019533D43|nr:aminopeptidase O isoform X3 [Oreochromis aureus]